MTSWKSGAGGPDMSTERHTTDTPSTKPSWMDASQWTYVLQNWGLICEVAKRWAKKYNVKKHEQLWGQIDSAAMMLFVNCLRSYDPSKGAFSTYYYNSAERTHGKYMQGLRPGYQHRIGTTVSIDALLKNRDREGGLEDEDMPEFQDSLCVHEETERKLMSQQLHAAIAKLPPELRKHAHETLSGTVDWNNTELTVATRREMLRLLREEMT